MKKCVICEKGYEGYGNNATPIKEGRCCDDCNEQVINKRLIVQRGEKMRQSIIRLKDITIDELEYPRDKINNTVVNRYVKDMENGDVFPPLYVGQIKGKGKKILIDGRHRYEAYLILGEEHIQCELKTNFVDKNDMFLASIRANSKHGLRYNKNSWLKITSTLSKMGFNIDDISKVTRIAVNKLESTIGKTIKHIFIQDQVKSGVLPPLIREKLPKAETIKVIDNKEIKKLEKANKKEFQTYQLKEILKYVKSEDFLIDDTKIENLIRNIKRVLKKRYPKL